MQLSRRTFLGAVAAACGMAATAVLPEPVTLADGECWLEVEYPSKRAAVWVDSRTGCDSPNSGRQPFATLREAMKHVAPGGQIFIGYCQFEGPQLAVVSTRKIPLRS